MCNSNKAYYMRRVEEEKTQFGLADNASVRSVHEKLVLLYEAKIVALGYRPHVLVPSSSRDLFQENFKPAPPLKQAAAKDSEIVCTNTMTLTGGG